MRERRTPAFRGLPALVVLLTGTALAAAGCSGEHALTARDAAGAGGTAGAGGSGGGDAGAGAPGSAGNTTGGASGMGGTGGSAGGAGGTSVGGAGASAGRGGTGGTAVAGTGGSGGTAGTGGTGGRPTGSGMNGSTCNSGGDCQSSYCWDSVCCATDCPGTCMTCAGTTKGVCVAAADNTDPRDKCAAMAGTSCGTIGMCNGAGACRYFDSSQVCDTTPSCDATNSSVVPMKVCNGAGACVPASTQSCNGFRCVAGSTPTCGTTCAADSGCATGGFCSAGSCVVIPNLAGNGDLETDTLTYWSPANGAGAVALSSVAASGVAHGGGYSVYGTNRSQPYHGPGYTMPTGVGKYVITAWGLQRSLAMINGILNLRVTCMSNTGYFLQVQTGNSLPMPQGVWTQFSATVDTSIAGLDCLPTGATPGLVRSAQVYLNHVDDTGGIYPDLYLDDLVVQVTDGHNLVGNPNFEAGLADGWSLSGGSSTLSVSATVAHGGTHSLHQATRSLPSAGPRWALPIGAARYAISFWVQHAGTQPHDLTLQPTYTCIGGSVTMPAPIATAAALAGNTWKQLSGTAVFPPANAPAGCKLSAAAIYVQHEGTACGTGTGQVECPDLYVDDVSITLAP